MPSGTKRGARKPSSSTLAQFRRLAIKVRRVTALVERNANEIEKLREEQRVQFRRFAQVQVELDAIMKAWAKRETSD